ncbi:hypothetical protein F383_39279 [Gossypium arboreum]|nr:hypothetical protein F383_39279 [Gossypium arboreum]
MLKCCKLKCLNAIN